ncbi:MAG: DMT family transporter [Cyclobacteriaceae bacterium]
MIATARDYLHLHFLVFIWGFTAVLGLLISIPAVEIVFYRTFFASIALFFLLWWRKRNFQIGTGEIIKIFATGFLIAGHWILFFGSARVSNVSVCLAGIATCSFWTSLAEPLMNRQKIKIFEVILGLVVIVGLYIIFRFEFNHALGLAMAVVSAILSAIFTVLNGKFTQKHNPYMITFYEMAGACVIIILFFPLYTGYLAESGTLQLLPTWTDIFYLLILALICTVYTYSASVELMKKVTAFAMNLTVNLEPVYGILLAIIVFGEKEHMQPEFYVGTFTILLSVLCYPLINKLQRRKAMKVDNIR